jgi:hypothetical protein
MVAIWVVVAFVAGRHTGQVWPAVKTATITAAATFAMLQILMIVRVNLFLGELVHRSDWQRLLMRFDASGSPSLRSFANREYVAGTPAVMAVGAAAGFLFGVVGGALGRSMRLTAKRSAA